MRLPLEEALLRYEACDAPPSYLSPAGRQYDVRPIFNELPQGRRLARGSACAGWISARSRVSAIGRRQLVDVCGGWEAADGGGVPQGTSLDERQIAAAKALLSRRLGLVQGPPGTGKTFIGLIVVRTLLRNARLWASSPARARAADRHALTAARAAEDEGGGTAAAGLVEGGGSSGGSSSRTESEHGSSSDERELAAAEGTERVEVEGLRLHLSSSNRTGYTGVSKVASGRFKATQEVDGRNVYLGTYDTAVQAAVAYARAIGTAPAVAEAAEGVRLHLSSSNATGYRGVHKARNGRYEAKRKKEGRFVYLGLFDTAVEAAVAHARAVAETDADEAAEASPADGAIPSASGGDGEPYRTIDGVAYIRALLDRATSLAKAGGTLAREIAR